MNNAAFLRRQRFRIGAALALLALGAFAAVRAQGQVCREVVNLTVCADRVATETSDGGFRLAGNIKIGPRGRGSLRHAAPRRLIDQRARAQRANGAPVPGRLSFITDLDGNQVIGLRFTPAAPLNDGRSIQRF
jgi:hypothetical protein